MAMAGQCDVGPQCIIRPLFGSPSNNQKGSLSFVFLHQGLASFILSSLTKLVAVVFP